MTAYRATDGLRSVCIVCFAFGARAAGVTCPRCGVVMPSPEDAEVRADLGRCVKRRAARAEHWRTAIVFGGAAVLALAGYIALIATGVYRPSAETVEVALGDSSSTDLGPLLVLWPAAILWFVFAALLQPVARKLVPPRALPPLSDVSAIAAWLGVRIIDDDPGEGF
jgi:hypothetical protein